MDKWQNLAEKVAEETRAALQLVYDDLNTGQRQKLLKNKDVKALFDRYGVEHEEVEAV